MSDGVIHSFIFHSVFIYSNYNLKFTKIKKSSSAYSPAFSSYRVIQSPEKKFDCSVFYTVLCVQHSHSSVVIDVYFILFYLVLLHYEAIFLKQRCLYRQL